MSLERDTAENDVDRLLEYWLKYRLILEEGVKGRLTSVRAAAAQQSSSWGAYSRKLEPAEEAILDVVKARGIDEVAVRLALSRIAREGDYSQLQNSVISALATSPGVGFRAASLFETLRPDARTPALGRPQFEAFLEGMVRRNLIRGDGTGAQRMYRSG